MVSNARARLKAIRERNSVAPARPVAHRASSSSNNDNTTQQLDYPQSGYALAIGMVGLIVLLVLVTFPTRLRAKFFKNDHKSRV